MKEFKNIIGVYLFIHLIGYLIGLFITFDFYFFKDFDIIFVRVVELVIVLISWLIPSEN